MDWSRGYSASYYLTIVDPTTWVDTSRIEITGGTVQRSDSDLLESGDFDCVNYQYENEQWIRVWLDARQEGEYSHTPVFTGLATSPNKSINGRSTSTSVQCFSVLKPAQDVLLPLGWYAPVDTNGGELIRRLLSVCSAPIDLEPDSANLAYPIIAESGETNLSMAWLIADAIGWSISITGDGRIRIGPYEKDSKWLFGVNSDDVLEPSLNIEYDWYSCPNIFRASSNGLTAIARDDNEDSPLSTVNRGREIWAEESDCDLQAGQSLTDYAIAKLKELQNAAITVSYTRRFNPYVRLFDTISLNYPEQNLVGNYMITSQNIDLGFSSKTEEEVVAL